MWSLAVALADVVAHARSVAQLFNLVVQRLPPFSPAPPIVILASQQAQLSLSPVGPPFKLSAKVQVEGGERQVAEEDQPLHHRASIVSNEEICH